ncbi:MAG: Asp-tRNA(Asn)/Glu-tRNA(Gln) amidotransferase subunit GatC [Cyclobacteriaceae bacterium]|nr:Asp-tRNA(Asn)/Glu-tRNA(Gln) amidotransferase subunit GatC [Cyclobacteriaceae bacterium]
MKINRELLDKMAHLARLEFDGKDAEKMMHDMTAIINWVEKLNEVETTGIEPLTSMSHEINSLREDKIQSQLTAEEVLKNAPRKTDTYFSVPKVLG